MNELARSLGERLSSSGLDHRLLPDLPDGIERWLITLRSGSQRITSELSLDAGRRLFIWRAPLLKGAKKRSRLFSHVYGDTERAMAFHALADGLSFARLRVNREDGAVMEAAFPLPQSMSEETFRFLLAEMRQAFMLRGIIQLGLDGGEMAWQPRDVEELPVMTGEQCSTRSRTPLRAEGRAAEISRAIAQGDIALARRLSRGADIDVPDSV